MGMVEGISLIILGTAVIMAFVYMSYVLEPRWFQLQAAEQPHASLGERLRDTHSLMGLAEAATFFIGTILITAGCLIIGTLHPTA
jgi:uncharacterized membrane protein